MPASPLICEATLRSCVSVCAQEEVGDSAEGALIWTETHHSVHFLLTLLAARFPATCCVQKSN